MSTGGSTLVRNPHPHIMRAGASARKRPTEAAAQARGAARADVTARQGVPSAGSRTASHGAFASAAAGITPDVGPGQKAYGDGWLPGRDTPRMDVGPEVNGSAISPIDVRVPGMLFAAHRAGPVPGGRVKSFDVGAIANRAGVVTAVEVQQTRDELGNADMRSAVAVVADTWCRARTALDLMPAVRDLGRGASNSFETMNAMAQAFLGQDAQHVEDVRRERRPVLVLTGNTIPGDSLRPDEAHVPISPPAAPVDAKGDRVDVRSCSPPVRGRFMAALGVDGLPAAMLAGSWDPREWRVGMTEGNARWQRVLLEMQELGGFATDLPRGQGMGVAVVESHGSTAGAIVTVEGTGADRASSRRCRSSRGRRAAPRTDLSP